MQKPYASVNLLKLLKSHVTSFVNAVKNVNIVDTNLLLLSKIFTTENIEFQIGMVFSRRRAGWGSTTDPI
jgi:hypothetical protein